MHIFAKTAATAVALTLGATSVSAEGKIVIYHWFEYIPQELLDKFTSETGIEVTMDTYDSNEAMLASLKAGGMGTYDVAVPGDYMVSIMIGEGMLDEIGDGELKNKGNIAPEWADPSFDPGWMHSIPYQWGSTSFMVDTAVYDGNIDTTDILFNPPGELSGKINMLDSQGEVLAMAALHLGIPQCSSDREQLKALNDMLQNAKAHWASFNSDTAKEVLVSGDAAVGQIYDGFGAKGPVRERKPEIRLPDPGLCGMDGQCRPFEGRAKSRQRDRLHGLPADAREHRGSVELCPLWLRDFRVLANTSIPSSRACRNPTHRPQQGQPCSLKSAMKPHRPCMTRSGRT